MSDEPNQPEQSQRDEFLAESQEERVSLVAEFWDFLKHNKKWWLLPIIIATIGIGLLIVWSYAAGASAFLYPGLF